MSRHTEVQGNKVLSGIPGMLGKHVSDVQTVDTKFFSLIFQTGLGMRIMLLLATTCFTLLLCYSVIHVQKNVVA